MRWILPKSLLICLTIIIVATTLAGLAWIFLKFNIPVLNGGDQTLVRCLAFFYWLVAGLFIFGFDLSDSKTG